MICPRDLEGGDSLVEHLKATGCPECLAVAQDILEKEAKAAVSRYLESLISGYKSGNTRIGQKSYTQ